MQGEQEGGGISCERDVTLVVLDQHNKMETVIIHTTIIIHNIVNTVTKQTNTKALRIQSSRKTCEFQSHRSLQIGQ